MFGFFLSLAWGEAIEGTIGGDPMLGFCLMNMTKEQRVRGSGRRVRIESKPDQEKGKTKQAGKAERK